MCGSQLSSLTISLAWFLSFFLKRTPVRGTQWDKWLAKCRFKCRVTSTHCGIEGSTRIICISPPRKMKGKRSGCQLHLWARQRKLIISPHGPSACLSAAWAWWRSRDQDPMPEYTSTDERRCAAAAPYLGSKATAPLQAKPKGHPILVMSSVCVCLSVCVYLIRNGIVFSPQGF